MDFDFTPEQSLLRESIAKYLTDHYTFEKRRAAVRSEQGWRPEIWKAFARELGFIGAALPEDVGGLGGGPIETMVIMEEFGKALVLEPYLGTVVVGGGILKRQAGSVARSTLAQIIGGEMTLAFAYAEPQGRYNIANVETQARPRSRGYMLEGRKAVVVGAPFASHLIVTARTSGASTAEDGISVFLVDKRTKGITTHDYATCDGSRASEVYFDNVTVPGDALIGAEGEAWRLLNPAFNEAIAAVSAEACGVLERLHAHTLEYTRQRKQFGRAISEFQSLQHRMVEMFIQLQQSISMTYMATMRLSGESKVASKAVSAAKVQINKACQFIGQNAVQTHGAMGMTEEAAVSHYFKRATMIESAFGNTHYHLQRYEALTA